MTRFTALFLLFSGLVMLVPGTVHAQVDGNRKVLCIKRIGKTNVKGRDAYLAGNECRSGYFGIDLSALAVTNSIPGEQGPAGKDGIAGPQGPQGAQGPQGIQGEPGNPAPEGSISGEVTVCASSFFRATKIVNCSLLGTSFGFRHVFHPAEQEQVSEIPLSAVEAQSFKIFNIPSGTYALRCDTQVSSESIVFSEMFEVVVSEGENVSVGTVHADYKCEGQFPT